MKPKPNPDKDWILTDMMFIRNKMLFYKREYATGTSSLNLYCYDFETGEETKQPNCRAFEEQRDQQLKVCFNHKLRKQVIVFSLNRDLHLNLYETKAKAMAALSSQSARRYHFR